MKFLRYDTVEHPQPGFNKSAESGAKRGHHGLLQDLDLFEPVEPRKPRKRPTQPSEAYLPGTETFRQSVPPRNSLTDGREKPAGYPDITTRNSGATIQTARRGNSDPTSSASASEERSPIDSTTRHAQTVDALGHESRQMSAGTSVRRGVDKNAIAKSALQELIDTGVFDFARHGFEDGAEGHVHEAGIRDTTPTYQDRATMISPQLQPNVSERREITLQAATENHEQLAASSDDRVQGSRSLAIPVSDPDPKRRLDHARLEQPELPQQEDSSAHQMSINKEIQLGQNSADSLAIDHNDWRDTNKNTLASGNWDSPFALEHTAAPRAHRSKNWTDPVHDIVAGPTHPVILSTTAAAAQRLACSSRLGQIWRLHEPGESNTSGEVPHEYLQEETTSQFLRRMDAEILGCENLTASRHNSYGHGEDLDLYDPSGPLPDKDSAFETILNHHLHGQIDWATAVHTRRSDDRQDNGVCGMGDPLEDDDDDDVAHAACFWRPNVFR